MLMNRAVDVQENLEGAKERSIGGTAYEISYDFYLAQFYAVNKSWIIDDNLKSRCHLILALKKMLDRPIDPDEDAVDPGRFQTFWGLHVKALIAEFESPIFK
jgi:hypothetical protein